MTDHATFSSTTKRAKSRAGKLIAFLTSPINALAGFGFTVVAAVLVCVVLISFQARDRALAGAKQKLANTAVLVARHFEQQLAEIIAGQIDLVERLRPELISSEDEFRKRMASARTHEMLRGKVNTAQVQSEFSIFGNDGRLIAWSNEATEPPVVISGRPYFKQLRDGADPAVPSLNLIRSTISGRWMLVAAVALRGTDGQFLGVLTRRIQLTLFTDFLASLDFPRGSSVAIHLSSGELVARYPDADGQIGRNFNTGSVEQRALFNRPSYSTRLNSPIDGEDRLLSAEALMSVPLVAIVTENVTTALRDWTAQTEALGRGAAVAIAALIVTFLLIIRLLTREHKAAAAMLTQERNRFALAVNNMTQGLVLFDGDHRLTLCNDRYLEMYGLTRDMIVPGCGLRDLIELRKRTRSPDIDVDAYCSKILLDMITGQVATATTGDERTVQLVHNLLPDGGWVATHTDVTEQENQRRFVEKLAHFDQLTNLPNRLFFRKTATSLLADLADDEALAVIYIDLDKFKTVNDTLGHRIGDTLLQHVAQQLRKCADNADLVARLGGDEFALLKSCSSREDLTPTLARIHELLRQTFDCEGHPISSDASIGVALAPSDGRDLDTLLANADLALYAAKGSGRHTHCFYNAEMSEATAARHLLETELSVARTNGFGGAGFAVHFQPVADLASGRIVGCEALLRWFHSTKGAISPADFIPIAEDSGIICALGAWVLETACRAAVDWPSQIRLAVNLSPIQVQEEGFVAKIDHILAQTHFPAERLELEITEAVLMRDHERTSQVLHQLRARGIKMVLDDFGTGYSSLSYLHSFDFDKIKIDRSFVRNMVESEASLSIVQSIIGLAMACGLRTTAEGVETESQRKLLTALGCKEMQGYLLSPAVSEQKVSTLLATDHIERSAETAA
ncbi:MAG TPA: EAL domain-containing protein [Bradyrhizobium sp.]|nr:EAL domain-containing protein [Bradyrhizobium sp.]